MGALTEITAWPLLWHFEHSVVYAAHDVLFYTQGCTDFLMKGHHRASLSINTLRNF